MFSSVTAIRPAGDRRFTADVHADWTIGGKPNGGYLLALLGRAAALVAPQPHVIAASAHYLRSPDPGPVWLTAELLRAGRGASQLRGRLLQDGRSCVEALLTVATLGPSQPYWSAGLPVVDIAPADDCIRLTGPNPSGLAVPMLDHIDLRVDPSSASCLSGRPTGRGEIRGWLALPGEQFDPVGLLFAVDAFPPATFDVALSGWVPTLELTAYVRALPAPGPVRVLHRAQLIDGQRVDETCLVWDCTGRLVAQSTQLAGIRF